MQNLIAPATSVQDDKVLSDACGRYSWHAHWKTWHLAYTQYRQHSGNPWLISASTFNPDISTDLYSLYDKRKNGGPLRRIRDAKGLLCCPVCGSGTTGSLDHYLPRIEYPEFSILRVNLVPACPHCNSGSKGTTYKGLSGERLIHPYYDAWADTELWFVKVHEPFAAATFSADPLASLKAEHKTILQFHLKTVLAVQFMNWAETRWARLPVMMADGGITKDEISVSSYIQKELSRAKIAEGRNGWNAALMRGILMNSNAISFLLSKLP